MKELYDHVAHRAARDITRNYSTSFSLGIRLLSKEIRRPIYDIYGFVRIADEIVDTFHEHDKEKLLKEFWEETHKALDRGISTNPVLQAFQKTVHEYKIDRDLIEQFLISMEMDLERKEYNFEEFQKYILGSAQVVGLMCLKVFVLGNDSEYERLKPYAMSLGSAFQKINFLRDLRSDYEKLGRMYFPQVSGAVFDAKTKAEIESDIDQDFRQALIGIIELPKKARFGVYLAYIYYTSLFNRIKKIDPGEVMKKRIRIPNERKFALLFQSYFRNSLGML